MNKHYHVYFLFLFLVAMDVPARAMTEKLAYVWAGLRVLGISSTLFVGMRFVESCEGYFNWKKKLRSAEDEWEKRSSNESLEKYLEKVSENKADIENIVAEVGRCEAEIATLSQTVVGESKTDKIMVGYPACRLWRNAQNDKFIESRFNGEWLLLPCLHPLLVLEEKLLVLNDRYRGLRRCHEEEREDAIRDDKDAEGDFKEHSNYCKKNMKDYFEGAVNFGSMTAIGTFYVASDLGLFIS